MQFAVDVGRLRLLALDTCVPMHSEGELDARASPGSSSQLEAAHRAGRWSSRMHHPPFQTLIGHMDKIGLLAGGPELEAIVVAAPATSSASSAATCIAPSTCASAARSRSTAPGPAHQVCLDLDPDAVSAWTLEPPSFRVHAWNPRERRLVTHLAASGSFEGPYPFYENGVLID